MRQVEHVITLLEVSKHYEVGGQQVKALDHASLSIDRGEFVSIIGPSGSGKSTMMNIIGCLDQADQGTYLLNGQPIEDYKENELAVIRNQQIGFVFQNFNLIGRRGQAYQPWAPGLLQAQLHFPPLPSAQSHHETPPQPPTQPQGLETGRRGCSALGALTAPALTWAALTRAAPARPCPEADLGEWGHSARFGKLGAWGRPWPQYWRVVALQATSSLWGLIPGVRRAVTPAGRSERS